jgi:NADH dehydrogenase [ubiquinone] 1 alpha subcomplex assembly factor 1
MRTSVRPGLEKRVRGGYAGFRNKHRSTLFGEMTEDLSQHRYLALRVRASGHPRTRTSYYVNLQTDGPVSTDLWQHRLYFRRDDGGWENLLVPLDSFVLTNSGEVSDTGVEMHRQRVRSIGISLLGGNSGVEGAYELGIDSVRAVNGEREATVGDVDLKKKPEDQATPLAVPLTPPGVVSHTKHN